MKETNEYGMTNTENMDREIQISNEDELFVFYETVGHSKQNDIAYYGWQKSHEISYYGYIEGYLEAANEIYNKFISSNSIKTKDTIIYPLLFICRQCLELFIKYFFITYSNASEDEKIEFYRNSHNLVNCWEQSRIPVKFLLERQNSNIDLNIVDHYISMFHNFDPNSFLMRYPTTRQNQLIHTESKFLDIKIFKEKFDTFIKYLKFIDFTIENQLIDNYFDKNLVNKILVDYKKYEIEIKNIINNLKPSEKFKIQNVNEKEFENQKNEFLKFDKKFFKLICTLVLSGRTLYLNEIKIAKEQTEKEKDIYKILEINFCELEELFKNDYNPDFIIKSKLTMGYDYLIKYLKFIINFLDILQTKKPTQ